MHRTTTTERSRRRTVRLAVTSLPLAALLLVPVMSAQSGAAATLAVTAAPIQTWTLDVDASALLLTEAEILEELTEPPSDTTLPDAGSPGTTTADPDTGAGTPDPGTGQGPGPGSDPAPGPGPDPTPDPDDTDPPADPGPQEDEATPLEALLEAPVEALLETTGTN